MKHVDESVRQHTPVNKRKWKEHHKNQMAESQSTTPKPSTTPTDLSSETDNSSSSASSPHDHYYRRNSCVLNNCSSSLVPPSSSGKKICSKRTVRAAILDQRRRIRQRAGKPACSPDRACSAPPRRLGSTGSSSSLELFSDTYHFDDSYELLPTPARAGGLTSTLGAYSHHPPTAREVKYKAAAPVALTQESPIPPPRTYLPASCEKPPLKPIDPLEPLEPDSRTLSNLARRTSSVPTGPGVPLVISDDGSAASPSDQSMQSDSESNAGSSDLFLPPTGAVNATPGLYRRSLGSASQINDNHTEEEDLENHPPSAFDSVLSRPPSCSGLSEHRHHPELQRVGAKNWSAWLRASISRAARRKTLTAGTSLFNLTPSQGIDYLIKAGVISNNPGAIAQFLTGPDLSCQAIGEYFGRLSDPLAVKVTKEFISRMDFEGLELDEALRRMLFRIHPDGESQKMEFLLHNFKESYERQNAARVARQFRDPETIYTLVYAIVMLHTALYNPSVRRLAKPMTCDQFTANLRGVDAGDNLNEEMLRAIYRRVACNEFKTVYDVMDRLHAVDQTLIGLVKPEAMLQRHRRFIGWTACYEVFHISGRRIIGSRPTSHLRGLFIFNDMILVTKPVRSYGSHAVSELLGTNILEGSLIWGASGSRDGRSTVAGTATPTASPSVRTHRRLRSLDAFVGGRISGTPGVGETSVSVAQQNEIQRRNRAKVLPGVCSTAIPANSQFQVRQVIPLLNIQVLVFGSGVYANGLELRDQEKGLVYLNLPTEEIRQKVIRWVHESIEETSELFRLNFLKENWLQPADPIPTF